MPNKTVTLPITLHVKDEKRSKEFKYDKDGYVLQGKLVLIEVPPGTPVSMDAAEADKLIARHDGALTDLPAAITVKPKVDDVDENEIIPLSASKASKASTAA